MYNEALKEKIKKDLQQSLSKHRYTHVLGVATKARELADKYGGDLDQAEVAGLLHDAAKQKTLAEMQTLARRSFGNTLPDTIMSIGSLLHGYAAVTIDRETYGIQDEDLLAALAHHTTGTEQMSTLEKIIFIADYIEVNRDFDGVERLRSIAAKDLDKAVLAGYDSTISHLLEQEKTIYTGTIINRNALILAMQADRKIK